MYDYEQDKELKYQYIIDLNAFELLTIDEKYEYLIENNILVNPKKNRNIFFCVYDRVPIDYLFEIKEFSFENYIDFNGFNYEINPMIWSEYLDHINANLFLVNDFQFDINNIEIKINTLFSQELQLKTLETIIKDQQSVFNEQSIGGLFLGFTNDNFLQMNWNEYSMEMLEDSLWIYLSNPLQQYLNDEHIKEWARFNTAKNIIEYCKNKIDEISKSSKEEENNLLIIKDLDVEELKTKGQKIMMMEELGIIDYIIEKYHLRINNTVNVNRLSNIIHSFTGLGVGTITPILAPMFKKYNAQKNNPKKEKNINLIKAKMIELGLKE